ncbi:hypothetical protein PR048_010540 [Dryococelus australis]|uniref:Uncharacterized protein n=1 Tax=Dryococelus australis TaxID=614101 RepID=A0ABQ9I309_9NEOP|nr:hypothetical protein PR048_010540 [Dryococelus australis]
MAEVLIKGQSRSSKEALAEVLNLLRSTSYLVTGAAPECKGGVNGISPRKPADPDQWYLPARFPQARIRGRPRQESNPFRLGGRRSHAIVCIGFPRVIGWRELKGEAEIGTRVDAIGDNGRQLGDGHRGLGFQCVRREYMEDRLRHFVIHKHRQCHSLSAAPALVDLTIIRSTRCSILAFGSTHCRSRCVNSELPISQPRELYEKRGAGETGDPRASPPINGIVRRESHRRKSGVTRPGIEPGSPSWEVSRLTAQPPWPRIQMTNHMGRVGRFGPAVIFEVLRADEGEARNSGIRREGKREIPEKSRRPAASSGLVLTLLLMRKNLLTCFETSVVKRCASHLRAYVRSSQKTEISLPCAEPMHRIGVRGLLSSPWHICHRVNGAAVAQRLAYSHPNKANLVRYPPPPRHLRLDFSHVGIVPDDAAGRRIFSGNSPYRWRRCYPGPRLSIVSPQMAMQIATAAEVD